MLKEKYGVWRRKMKLISDRINLNFYYSCICDLLKDHSNLSTKVTDLK